MLALRSLFIVASLGPMKVILARPRSRMDDSMTSWEMVSLCDRLEWKICAHILGLTRVFFLELNSNWFQNIGIRGVVVSETINCQWIMINRLRCIECRAKLHYVLVEKKQFGIWDGQWSNGPTGNTPPNLIMHWGHLNAEPSSGMESSNTQDSWLPDFAIQIVFLQFGMLQCMSRPRSLQKQQIW